MTPALVDAAVVTIFAREFLEGSIIVGQYRTIVLVGGDDALHPPGTPVKDALRAITLSSLLAAALALLVLACVAIPLAVLSKSFDKTTAEYIEAASKAVASVSLLALSLKIPRFLGIYGKRRKSKGGMWKLPCPSSKAWSSQSSTRQRNSSSRRTSNSNSRRPTRSIVVVSTPAEDPVADVEEVGDADDDDDDENDVLVEEARSGGVARSAAVALNEINRSDDPAEEGGEEEEGSPGAAAPNAVETTQGRWRRPAWWPWQNRQQEQQDSSDATAVTSGSNSASRLTLREIRFNVAWNLWREVAECGAFLLPSFLTGSGTTAIPLSAVIGGILGLGIGVAVYAVNMHYQHKRTAVCVFATLLMVFFSAGLFTGACHILEEQIGSTPQVWHLQGRFWDAHDLPMTLLKPFGYDDARTVLEIASYWLWLALAGLLHYHWYRTSPRLAADSTPPTAAAIGGGGDEGSDAVPRVEPSPSLESTVSSPSLTTDMAEDEDDEDDSSSVKKEEPSRVSCGTTDVETNASLVDPTQPPRFIDV